jgi:hypothetical protein
MNTWKLVGGVQANKIGAIPVIRLLLFISSDSGMTTASASVIDCASVTVHNPLLTIV